MSVLMPNKRMLSLSANSANFLMNSFNKIYKTKMINTHNDEIKCRRLHNALRI